MVDNAVKNGAKTLSDAIVYIKEPFAKWRNSYESKLAESVKFGDWRVSHAIGGQFKQVIDGIDPVKHPIDKNAAFDNIKIWRNDYKINDGVYTHLDVNPWIYYNMTSFVTREINSSKDQTIPLTLGMSNVIEYQIFFNGEKIFSFTE